jgi:transcriptional regulator with XRE-family HTH domain
MALSRLRRARLERGMTQLDVSLKARLAPSRLSLIEREILLPTGEELSRLIEVLELDARPKPGSDGADGGEEAL